MITPRFEVSQDEEFVFIKVFISSVRFSAAALEMTADDEKFIFSLPPYYLRLRFSGGLVDDERAKAEFVTNNDCISIQMPKAQKGEVFGDLDLPAKLLGRIEAPKKQGVLIEELGSTETTDSLAQEAEQFDWEVEQVVQEPVSLVPQFLYGFDNKYSDMMDASISNGNDINELSNPDKMAADERINERLIKENLKFDAEYYANDYLTEKYFASESNIKQLVAWENPVYDQYKHHKQTEFTAEENDKMMDLPKKSYLVENVRPLYYTIVCILYAYLYEVRQNEGDTTVESGWTVGKLVPQFSCLDSQLIQSNNETENNMLKVVAITMSRRSLCFPLVRHWKMVKAVWDDVYYTLRCGTRAVLKTLIACRELFRFHDVYYIYCKIWLDDLCAWTLTKGNDTVLRNLGHELRKTVAELNKENVVFEKILAEGSEELEFVNLLDIEQLAEISYNESQ
ncbi:hypothetical protein OGAPHI_003781 [Ogataea philodendri]|uniref:CS domain-containing protein n=1 Tax=Ogataea philodendri TaxID=1378263 RepID=A0A9P8P500_9ASCO|nr:uncharacterized protein OGAPHI_003781 [Ogataea philodendri]KAH3665593.1 hypothetical protein OGAPHI_003781 [Ogataea philodendri]